MLKGLNRIKSIKPNFNFGKVFLILTLVVFQSLCFKIPVSEASTVLYYYDKYSVNNVTYYDRETSSYWLEVGYKDEDDTGWSETYYNMFDSYKFDSNTGLFEPIGSPVWSKPGNSSSHIGKYAFGTNRSNTNEKKSVIYKITGRVIRDTSGSMGSYEHTPTTRIRSIANYEKVRGDYISTITGDGSQYPSDGIHTDGYWYVKGVIVNNSPTILLSKPSTNSYFGKESGHNTIPVQVNVKDDDVGDALKAYYRLNGSAGQAGTKFGNDTIANGANQTISGNIPSNVVTALSNGTHTLYMWVEDDKGGKSAETSVSIKIDKTNPTAPIINTNANWSKDNVSATITPGTDSGSGILKTEYSLSGATTSPWTTYTSAITIQNQGQTTIKSRTIDNVGNISSEATKVVSIDKISPTLTITDNDTNWHNSNLTVNITHEDTGGSGVATKQYSVTNSTTKPTSEWNDLASSNQNIEISNEGNNYVHVKIVDGAGNETYQYKGPFKIDKTNATGTITGKPIEWTNEEIVLTIEAFDSLSGVKRIQNPDGTWISGDTASYSVATSGEYSFIIEDNAGNQTTLTETIDNIDTKAPGSPSITLSNSGWSNKDIIATVISGEEPTDPYQSGIEKSQYKIGEDGTWTDYTDPITISDEGVWQLYARTIDKVGNISEETFETIYIDKTLPYGSISGVPIEWINSEEVTLTLEAYDALSGVKRIQRPDGTWVDGDIANYNASTNGEYNFVIEDNAGNQATLTETIDKMDKTIPIVNKDDNGYIIDTWSKENINIDLIYEDLDSGIKHKQYKITNSPDIPADWEDYSESIKLSDSGIFYLHYEAIDVAGNKAQGYYGPYKIDKSFPDIEITLTPDTDTKNEVTMNIKTESSFSNVVLEKFTKGVRDVEFFSENGDVFNSPYEIKLTENETYTFYSMNEAGNETIKVYTVENAWKTAYDNALAAVQLAELNIKQENIDSAQDLINILPEGWDERIILQDRLDVVKMIINLKESIENIVDMDDVKDIIDFIDNNLSDHSERDDLVENVADKAIPIVETKEDIDYVQDVINTVPQPNRDVLQDKLDEKIKELIEDKLKDLEDLINDAEVDCNQDKIDDIYDLIDEIQDLIDRLPEGIEKDELQDQLDKLKDKIDAVQDIVNVIKEFNIKLDNARLDFTNDQAVLILDMLNTNEKYTIKIVDLETNSVVISTATNGGNINVPGTKQGHNYRVELEAYYKDEKLAERSFEKLKPDTVIPDIEYAYMLDGVLNVFATDNYKLHAKPYAFRIISDGESIEVIENTVIDSQFGTVAWTINKDGIMTINYQENGIFPVAHPKTVVVRVRDLFGNITNATLDITKANESLLGDVPQDIIDQINEANNPPKDTTNSNENKDNEITIIEKDLSDEAKKEITGSLENDNINIDPIDTGANSQEGGLSIDIKDDLEKLNNIIKRELGDGHDVFYRITVSEKETDRLVYTKVSANVETLLIPNLKDSTAYNIKISLVSGNLELAFREVERMTYDKTPPVIERIIVRNNTVEIAATDNLALHNKAYQYSINNDGEFANNTSVLLASSQISDSVQILVSNFGSDVWTEKSRLTGLDTGTKVRVIVRDHADNYTISDFEVKDGLVLDSINSDDPLAAQIGDEFKEEDLIKEILEEYNKKNPDDQYDLSNFNPDNFTIKSSDTNIAYFEDGKLVIKNSGTVVIILTDKTTGKSYMYTIVVSKYVAFNRRIVVQTNSETDLARVFEDRLYKEFKDTPIFFTVSEGIEYGHMYGSIFKSYEEEGVVTVIASDGDKTLPLYVVVVKDEYPESDIEIIVANVAYVVKVGDEVNITEVSAFYNELYEETNNKYLVAEVNTDVLSFENNIIKAVNEGIGVVSIIDLAKNRVEEIDFKVVDLYSKSENTSKSIETIKGHWAEETITELSQKGIIEIVDDSYNPNGKITREEFLSLLSKTRTYQKETTNERRSQLPLDLDNLLNKDNKYFVLDVFNGLTMFEIEYVFGKDLDLTKEITREEVATILAITMDLKAENTNHEFKDTILSRYKGEVQTVKENGLMVGYSDGNFGPTNNLTKAELAVVMQNILNMTR